MKAKVGVLCAALLAVGAQAQAQSGRDRREVAGDRAELRQDHRELQDDWQDLRRLQSVLVRFDTARRSNDVATLSWVDSELQALVRAEVRESRGELARDRAEVRRDNREIGRDVRDASRNDAQGRPGRAARDMRDMRDDQRDRRDDVRDAHAEFWSMERVRGIGTELSGLYGRTDAPSLDRKRVLLVELLGMARQEVRRDRKEIREDQHELREDRRELRQDERGRR